MIGANTGKRWGINGGELWLGQVPLQDAFSLIPYVVLGTVHSYVHDLVVLCALHTFTRCGCAHFIV